MGCAQSGVEHRRASGGEALINGIGMKMVVLPPGRVTAPETSLEIPLPSGEQKVVMLRPVKIRIFQPFYLASTETTQEQWTEVMGSNPSPVVGRNLPVQNVRYEQAVEFCQKLTERERKAGRLPEGWAYRLPTSSQWQYAAVAGEPKKPSVPLRDRAWFAENAGGRPHPVGTKSPNARGLYDLYGNVAEWCLKNAQLPARASALTPLPSRPVGRMARGGSFRSPAQRCTPVSVMDLSPHGTSREVGFRVVLVPGK